MNTCGKTAISLEPNSYTNYSRQINETEAQPGPNSDCKDKSENVARECRCNHAGGG